MQQSNPAQQLPPLPPPQCEKGGGGCDFTPPNQCFGTFSFAGLEGDGAEGSVFVGSILESTVSNLDVGSLYEGALGGEGGVVGGAVTQSFRTGKTGGFAFGGGSLSAGPLAGLQVGMLLSGNDVGLYYETHRGPVAGGGGFAFSACGGSSQ